MLSTKPEKIRVEAKRTADRIRAYCRFQRSIWQEIPALAIEADGRNGFSDRLSEAMHFQLWRLSVPPYPNAQMFVCLYTGRIVSLGDTRRLAAQEEILRLAENLELIDAKQIATELRRAAKDKVLSMITPRSKLQKSDIRQQLAYMPRRGPVGIGCD